MGLIDADALIEKYGDWYVEEGPEEGFIGTIKHLIDAQPTIKPERPKGKWIHQGKFSRVECDQCGNVFRNTFAPKNFCPNCGADMRGEQK